MIEKTREQRIASRVQGWMDGGLARERFIASRQGEPVYTESAIRALLEKLAAAEIDREVKP